MGQKTNKMAGGLMQLVAYGAQDVYLTGNPKVTFFQAVYKRHTNFAMENIEQTVNGTAANSGRVSVTVARNGDLIADMYVELTAKQAFASNEDAWVAESAISTVELSIGGQRIDKHYQKWWRLYAELYMDEAKKLNYGKMCSATVDNEKVFLPLIFFFNRNPGLALPLIALQYHEVRIDFDLSSVYSTNFDSFKVWGNYIYLDTEERRRFAQKGHEYLIEQVQHTGSDAVSAGSKQIRLSYNHPVKELVWCVEKTEANSANSFLWNFTTASPIATCDPTTDAVSNVAVSTSELGAPVILQGPNAPRYSEETGNQFTDFKLVLNGQDRMKAQGSKYFNQVQPFNHHSGCPAPGIYLYSFALKPEEHQPTGTCNFSRIDNAQVAITLPASCNPTLSMFATNYNVLRIQSGMGGLAF